jgi:hypothetical protein
LAVPFKAAKQDNLEDTSAPVRWRFEKQACRRGVRNYSSRRHENAFAQGENVELPFVK